MIEERRIQAGTAGLLVLVLLTSGLTGSALAADSQVAITSVTISEERVQPNEMVTVTATIRNAQTSPSPARITEVGIRGDGILETSDDLGTIGAGESIQVPLSIRLDEPGTRRLTYFVTGVDRTGAPFSIQYPVFITVDDPTADVGLTLETPDLIAGEDATVNVTVSNGRTDPISALELALSGDSTRVDPARRLHPTVAAGTERTFPFEVRVTAPGPHDLTATLAYATADGDDRSVSTTTRVGVEDLRIDAELAASVDQTDGDRAIVATIENFGNVPLTDVVVSVTRNGERLDRVNGPDIPPGDAGSVSIDADDVPAATLDISATYEAAGRTNAVATTLQLAPAVDDRIELAGVDVARADGRLTISGDAANVGAADATAVLLRVVSTDEVRPVTPNREYFIGTIDASEFATFELTAAVDPDTAAVPVEIQFTVDGTRHTRTVSVDVADVAEPAAGSPGSPSLLVGGIVLAIVVVTAVWWRRRR